MSPRTENLRLVLGLKLRALRSARGWTLQNLAARTGVGYSYLSEIEQGKKYPKPAKLLALAEALEVSYEDLVAARTNEEVSPLAALAESDFLREFPFELFGIEASGLLDFLARDAERSVAMLRAFGDVARRHDLEVEQILLAALRCFQQMHRNHFPEIERAAERFRREAGWEGRHRLGERDLRRALEEYGACRVDSTRLAASRELADLRALLAPGPPPVLHVNGRLTPVQRIFAMARELGFRVLGSEERAPIVPHGKARSFEQALASFQASYFAGALLAPRTAFAAELRRVLAFPRFRPEAFAGLAVRFGITPETLCYRMTEILPAELGFDQLFFVRFLREAEGRRPRLSKVFSLLRDPLPLDFAAGEHFCRRWPALALIDDARLARARPGDPSLVAGACTRFQSAPVEFLALAFGRRLTLQPRTLSTLSIGLLVDDRLRDAVGFLDDPALRRVEVDLTCERCPLSTVACRERAAPASVLAERRRAERRERAIAGLVGGASG
jgi:XRE family transcriptional regulator, fatty acid utilization regulator